MNLFGSKTSPFGWGDRKIINPEGEVFIVNSILPKRLSLETINRDREIETVRIKKMRQEDWKIAEYKGDTVFESDPMKDLKGFKTVIINDKGDII